MQLRARVLELERDRDILQMKLESCQKEIGNGFKGGVRSRDNAEATEVPPVPVPNIPTLTPEGNGQNTLNGPSKCIAFASLLAFPIYPD